MIDYNRFLEKEIENGTFPGIVLLVQKENENVLSLNKGFCSLHPDKEPMSADTLFDLASLTKPFASTITALKVLENNKIDLNTPIGTISSRFNPETAKITFKQLILHTSGLPADPGIHPLFPEEKDIDKEEALNRLFSITPLTAPGSKVVYSCTGYMLLSALITEISGKKLSILFKELVTDPGEIKDLCFHLSEEQQNRAASTEFCKWRKRWIKGEVHDESSFCFNGEGGNAGLFGTASSVMKLVSLFSSGGCLNKKNILTPEQISLMTTCQTGNIYPSRTAGFLTQNKGSFTGKSFRKDAFGHTGFTGTSIWIDPENRLKIVTLTNRVHLGRDETKKKIQSFRKRLHTKLKIDFSQ